MGRTRWGALALATAAGALLSSCAPPGGELQDRTARGGEKAAQLVAPTPKDANRCNVQPPDVKLRGVKIGFAQVENNNPFRIAETASLQPAAKQRGGDRRVPAGQAIPPKQVSGMQGLVAEKVAFIVGPPGEELALAPARETARKAHVPVLFADRAATATPCRDFLTFIGSGFV